MQLESQKREEKKSAVLEGSLLNIFKQMNDLKLKIQEAQQSPNSINKMKSTLRLVTMKLLKTEYKEEP